MQILISGSTGFLGKYIFAELSKNNQVTRIGRGSVDIRCELETKIPKIESAFDLVVHVAGTAHQLCASTKQLKDAYLSNIKGTRNLLNAVSWNIPPKMLVFISSVSVYGVDSGELIKESSPLLASDYYGRSKVVSEADVFRWGESFNVKCTVLRLPLVYGENPPGNLRRMIDSIQRARYVHVGGGVARRSVVLAEDVASAIIKSAKVGGVYNLTDGIHPSLMEIADAISRKHRSRPIPSIPVWFARVIARFGDRLPGLVPLNSAAFKKVTSTLTFDDTRARSAFGWCPSSVVSKIK